MVRSASDVILTNYRALRTECGGRLGTALFVYREGSRRKRAPFFTTIQLAENEEKVSFV
jgi:hypothetical protein